MNVISPLDGKWLTTQQAIWLVQIWDNLISRYWICHLAYKLIYYNCREDGEMKIFPCLLCFLFTTSRHAAVLKKSSLSTNLSSQKLNAINNIGYAYIPAALQKRSQTDHSLPCPAEDLAFPTQYEHMLLGWQPQL